MKKETGFTLMELLAVITILSIIALIVTPVINNLRINARQKLYEEQVKRIENFSLRYIIDNNTDFLTDGTTQIIQLNQLVISGYIQETDIVDPRNDDPMPGCVTTTWDLTANNYIVSYEETCPA